MQKEVVNSEWIQRETHPYKSKGKQVRILHNNIVDKVKIFFEKKQRYEDIKFHAESNGLEYQEREKFDFDWEKRTKWFCRISDPECSSRYILIPKDQEYYTYTHSISFNPFRHESFDHCVDFVSRAFPDISNNWLHKVSEIAFGSLFEESIDSILTRFDFLYKQKIERYEDRKRVKSKGPDQYGATIGSRISSVLWNAYDKLYERNDKRRLSLDGSKLPVAEVRNLPPITRVDCTLFRDAIRDSGIDSIQDLKSALSQGASNPLLFPFKNLRETSAQITTVDDLIKDGAILDPRCRRKCVPERFVSKAYRAGWFQSKYEDRGLSSAKKAASGTWGMSAPYYLKQILSFGDSESSFMDKVVQEIDQWVQGTYLPEEFAVELPKGDRHE